MADMSATRGRQIVIALILLGAGFGGGYCTCLQTKMVESEDQVARAVCWHLDGSRWECPDSSANLTLFQAGNDIQSGSLTLTTALGSQTFAVPAGVDAVFLTPAGLQILQAHYVATDSAKAAAVGQYLDWTRRQP